jgi:putative hydrolase of the HAD superfamily
MFTNRWHATDDENNAGDWRLEIGLISNLQSLFSQEFIVPIKAITFDFWATLYKTKTIDYTQRLHQIKAAIEQKSSARYTVEEFQMAFNLARDTWGRTWRQEHRTMSAAQWLAVIQHALGISLATPHLAQIEHMMENNILEDLPALAPEVQTVLADLSQRYRLAVISDTGITPGRVLRQLLERDNLSGFFSHLTFSDEVGRSKPHPQAFMTTLNALGAAPAEAVHVGDLLRTDIAGAQGVGMRAVQYIGISHDHGESVEDGLKIRPDAVIQSHNELKPLLRQWNGIKVS